jgi:diguanylate cyclase (GGDEF)-like protein
MTSLSLTLELPGRWFVAVILQHAKLAAASERIPRSASPVRLIVKAMSGSMSQRLSLRLQIYVLVALIGLVFVVTMVASIMGRMAVGRSVSTLGETLMPIRIQSSELSRAYVNQETGQRGFLITGDPVTLEPYYFGTATIDRLVPELRQQLTKAPHADQLLDMFEAELSAAAAWKSQAADPQIAFQRAGDIPHAQLDQMVIEGKALFDKLRDRFRALNSRIDSLIAEQVEHVRSVLNTVHMMQLIAFGAFIVSIVGIVIAVRRLLTEPVSRLVRNVRAVADGDYDQPIGRAGPREISEIAAAVDDMRDKLERLARFDSVTGLANRAETMARFKSALENSMASGARLGVLFCDIDHFKAINDTWGHAVGDAVLSTLATRMRECVRLQDTVGRIGGDEMLILLPGVQDSQEVIEAAERIRARAAEPISQFGITVRTSLSIGATTSSAAENESIATLTARADGAMYQAKHSGRNVVVGVDS